MTSRSLTKGPRPPTERRRPEAPSQAALTETTKSPGASNSGNSTVPKAGSISDQMQPEKSAVISDDDNPIDSAFLKALFPSIPEGGYLIAAGMPKDPKAPWWHIHASDVEDLCDACRRLNTSRDIANAYMALGVYGKRTPFVPKGTPKENRPEHGKDRTRANVIGLQLLAIDLDVDPSGKNPKKYKSKAAALMALKGFTANTGLRLSALVDSGGGLHAYILLDRFLPLAEWQPLAELFKAVCLSYGLKIDPAISADAARVLRPVGALNRKTDPPRPVMLVRPKDGRYEYYNVDDIRAKLEAAAANAPLPATADVRAKIAANAPAGIQPNPDFFGDLGSGGGGGFDALSDADKDAELRKMLAALPAEAWRRSSDGGDAKYWPMLYAACARSGAPNAESILREFASAPDATGYDAADFDRRYGSFTGPFDPDDRNITTIGSLIEEAVQHGYVKPWRKGKIDKPLVILTAGEDDRIVDEIHNHLAAAHDTCHIYRFNGSLCQVGETIDKVQRVQNGIIREYEVSSTVMHQLSASAMCVEAGAVITFEKMTDGEKPRLVRTSLPVGMARKVLDTCPRYRSPIVKGISNTPIVRANGTVYCRNGYDDGSQIYLSLGGLGKLRVPQNPTMADAKAAVQFLLKQNIEFAFAGNRSLLATLKQNGASPDELRKAAKLRQQWLLNAAIKLAMDFTAVLRQSMALAPAFGVTANTPGTGKSAAVDSSSILRCGHIAVPFTWPAGRNPAEEGEKRIGALLKHGRGHIAIDNISTPIESDQLCSMLTQEFATIRVLGESNSPILSTRTLVTFTGNNLALVGDLIRRVLVCELEALEQRPWLRQFQNNLYHRFQAQRVEIIEAILTIVLAWVALPRKEQTKMVRQNKIRRNPQYPEWDHLVRLPLRWLGLPDIEDCYTTVEAADPETNNLREVIAAWEAKYKHSKQRLATVVQDANMGAHPGASPIDQDLYEALHKVAGPGKAVDSRRLSHYLRRNKKRIVDGRQFVDDTTGKMAQWGVANAPKRGSIRSKTP